MICDKNKTEDYINFANIVANNSVRIISSAYKIENDSMFVNICVMNALIDVVAHHFKQTIKNEERENGLDLFMSGVKKRLI